MAAPVLLSEKSAALPGLGARAAVLDGSPELHRCSRPARLDLDCTFRIDLSRFHRASEQQHFL
jgi:hypothetical protein